MEGWRGTIWDGGEVSTFLGQAGGCPIKSEEQRVISNHLEQTSKPHILQMFFFNHHYYCYYFWAAHQEQYSQFVSLRRTETLDSLVVWNVVKAGGRNRLWLLQRLRLQQDIAVQFVLRFKLQWMSHSKGCKSLSITFDPSSGAMSSSDAAQGNHYQTSQFQCV